MRHQIPEMLRRSKQSPLTVYVERAALHGLLSEVKKHFGRVRELLLWQW